MAFAMVSSLFLFSCLHEDDAVVPRQHEISNGKQIVLGRKLTNPYTLSAMEEALNLLKDSDPSFEKIEVRTTHLYVKFKPESYLQYDRLVQDSTLNLLDHPFDYEIEEEGEFYHDPSLPDTVPTYQYASVPVDFAFPPDIPYEILEELYLPEEDENLDRTNGRLSEEAETLVSRLELQSLQLTGNLDEEEKTNEGARTNGWLPDKWYPSGFILVFDNRVNDYIPLVGAKVKVRRWFKIRYTLTNRRGHYEIDDGFRYAVNYSIPWERGKFDIRSGTFGQAYFNGPKKKGSWNLKISQNGMSFHYAHVFRAAWTYNYGDAGGLRRPGFRIKYSVFDKQGDHLARNLGNWSLFGINPNILIYRYDPVDGSENASDEMFSTTCHETAHSTHMEVMRAGMIQFLQVSETIRESWAVGVEWYLTQLEYKRLGISNYAEPSYNVSVNYPIQNAFQYWSRSRMPNVTSLFIDVVDQNNQKGQTFGGLRYGSVDDDVFGYSLPQIEGTMLKNVYGLASLKDELAANKPGELSEREIELLLENF